MSENENTTSDEQTAVEIAERIANQLNEENEELPARLAERPETPEQARERLAREHYEILTGANKGAGSQR